MEPYNYGRTTELHVTSSYLSRPVQANGTAIILPFVRSYCTSLVNVECPRNLSINQMSNPGRHGRNTMRKKQGTSVCRSFFSLLNMQSNNNEAAILPIDSFLEKSFPFTDITLHLSADAITFLMGTTKGRLNLMYYLYILHTMTIGDKSQWCEASVSIRAPVNVRSRSLPLKKCGVSSVSRGATCSTRWNSWDLSAARLISSPPSLMS